MRNHQHTTLKVRVGVLPASETGELMPADALPGSGFDALGLAIRPLTQTERRQFKLKEGGVVVDQVNEGAARHAGFKPGDVVLMMNGTVVTGVRQFQRLEGQLSAAHPVPVLVQRPGTTMFLPLQISGS